MTLLHAPCPWCEFPRLLARTGCHRYRYGPAWVCVDGIEHAFCHHCGRTCFLPAQAARNEERITEANLLALTDRWVTRAPVDPALVALARVDQAPALDIGVAPPGRP